MRIFMMAALVIGGAAAQVEAGTIVYDQTFDVGTAQNVFIALDPKIGRSYSLNARINSLAPINEREVIFVTLSVVYQIDYMRLSDSGHPFVDFTEDYPSEVTVLSDGYFSNVAVSAGSALLKPVTLKVTRDTISGSYHGATRIGKVVYDTTSFNISQPRVKSASLAFIRDGGPFRPFTLPVTITESVPEPGSWALMLIGFAAVGRALRHRRSAGPTPALISHRISHR